MKKTWTKSTYSVANSACVEVALSDDLGEVLMRDSKDPSGGFLAFSHNAWTAFVEDLRKDRLR